LAANVTLARRTSLAVAVLALGAAVLPPAAQATHRPRPHVRQIRCVPAGKAACKTTPTAVIGDQIRFVGVGLYHGMRVSFRWPKGTINTRMKTSGRAFWVFVPAGTRAGTVSVVLRDGRGRRSNVVHIKVKAPPKPPGPPAGPPGALPAAFSGSGMWIWQLPKSEGGDPAAIAARAHATGISTVFIKSADGTTVWSQFTPALVQALHADGLRACAWQYVYGKDPTGEAAAAATAVTDGADCLVIDAETEYGGRYAQAQQYLFALRTQIGPDYPLGLTSFPYVDYHSSVPYSVFLGPGGAQANLPQVYWKAIGNTVDAVSAHTLAHNRIYGVPIAPLGQSYDNPPPADIERFAGIWKAYGSLGVSYWSWQATGQPAWDAIATPVTPVAQPDPGWPGLGKGDKGDEVVWLQQHLKSYDPALAVDGGFGSATEQALRGFQGANGLPVTGTADAATWQALLKLPLQPVSWQK
jgi:peptidoglycan hydrolase-like protein with peptidoglycan-binding domain